MPNLTSVGVTSGVPSSGTGTVSTIDQLLAAGIPLNNGSSSVQVAVTQTSSAPTSSMNALVVGLSPNSVNANGQATMANSAPVVLASNQSALPFIIYGSTAGSNANVVAGSSAVTSTMAALVVALSTLGAGGSVTLSSAVTLTSVNTLWNSGTAFNGQYVAPFTILSSEAVSLASSAMAVCSSVTSGTSSGIFSSSMTGQALFGEVFLTIGTTVATVAGGNVAGWFLQSFDGGTTFESTTYVPVSRPPDWIVPITSATIGASTPYKAIGPVPLPALQFKVAVQNNLGVVVGTSSGVGYPVVKLAPVAQQGG